MNPQEVAYLQYVMAVYGFTRLSKGEYTAQEFAETLARLPAGTVVLSVGYMSGYYLYVYAVGYPGIEG